MLGGDFSGRYHLTNDQVRKFTGYHEQINQEIQDRQSAISTLRSDTDSAVTTLRSDTDKAVTTLRTETNQAISTLRSDSETSDREIRKEAQTSVRDLKAEKDREIQTLNADIAEAKTAMAGQVSEISERQEALEETQADINVRFDEALEGLTEDSEVIDARVDAENTRHVNLGANVRNIHRLLIHAGEDIRYQAQEFQGLLQQYGELVRAQIRGELNAIEAHERRKFEIQQEALSRYQGDTSLQSQVDLLAENDIENALTRKIERETSRAEHNRERNAREQADNAEISQRVEFDDVLQAQINQLANSILQSTINFRNSLERRKNEIRQEILTRSQNDEDLHSRLDESLAMCGMLQSQVDALVSAVFQINSSLDGMTDNAYANIQNAITIAREINTRREAVKQEVLTRNKQDAGILEQINQLAYSILRLTVQQDETSRRVSEVEIEKASAPGQVATDSEFDEMLDELYDKP